MATKKRPQDLPIRPPSCHFRQRNEVLAMTSIAPMCPKNQEGNVEFPSIPITDPPDCVADELIFPIVKDYKPSEAEQAWPNKYQYPEFAGFSGERYLRSILYSVAPLAVVRTWEAAIGHCGPAGVLCGYGKTHGGHSSRRSQDPAGSGHHGRAWLVGPDAGHETLSARWKHRLLPCHRQRFQRPLHCCP